MVEPNVFNGVTKSKIFKNRDLLDPSEKVSRDKIVGRETQIEELTYQMKQLVEGSSAKNFMVTGDTGVGKSMITKLVLEDFEKKVSQNMDKDIEVIYTENNENERSVLLEISEKLELDFRGRSSLETYYNLMEEKIVAEGLNVILVVDEINMLFQESKNKDHGNSLLKQLLDTRKNIKEHEKGYLQIIGITNDGSVLEKLDPKVKSRSFSKEINFPSYNSMELKNILEKRVDDAFVGDPLEEGVLKRIAAEVAQKEGDARTALEILDEAAEIVDKDNEVEKITQEHVLEADYNLEQGRIEDKVNSLSKHQKILFLAALILHKKKPITGELFNKYDDLCDGMDINELTQRRVVSLIKKLDNLGLVTTSRKKSVRGNTREIKISFDEEMSENLMRKIEESLSMEGEYDVLAAKQRKVGGQ